MADDRKPRPRATSIFAVGATRGACLLDLIESFKDTFLLIRRNPAAVIGCFEQNGTVPSEAQWPKMPIREVLAMFFTAPHP